MRKLLPIIILVIFFAAGTWFGTRTGVRLPPGPTLDVFFLNVGQGDCALAQTPDGKNILIDAGDEDAGPGVVQFLKSHGVKRIDLLVMSHPHPDYAGGVPDVLEAFPVHRVLDSAYPVETALQHRIYDVIEREQIPYYAAQAGQKLKVGKNLDLYVLLPEKEFLMETGSDANNNSIVLQLVFNRIKFLFTGDIEREAEGQLIGSEQDLESNVLKVAHHGSDKSTSLEFLRMVKPEFCVISAGQGNTYNHPHADTLKRLSPERLGSELFRTDIHGTVAITTDGKTVVVETER